MVAVAETRASREAFPHVPPAAIGFGNVVDAHPSSSLFVCKFVCKSYLNGSTWPKHVKKQERGEIDCIFLASYLYASRTEKKMAPYFETVKSFADVPILENGVDTASFLEASDGLVNMFDLLGSGVFGFVQNDIRGNISGVRNRYDATKSNSDTLEKLVRHETGSDRYGTACLVRLTRGLAFTCEALQNMQRDKSSELHICFKRSYDSVLRHHHTFLIRSVVSVAIRAVPRRQDFYQRIAQGGSVEKLDVELARWLAGLDVIVKHTKLFLEEGGFGRV